MKRDWRKPDEEWELAVWIVVVCTMLTACGIVGVIESM